MEDERAISMPMKLEGEFRVSNKRMVKVKIKEKTLHFYPFILKYFYKMEWQFCIKYHLLFKI